MYTPGLFKGLRLGSQPPNGTTLTTNMLSRARNWERVAPLTFNLVPCYADCYKRHMGRS
jgi:hypothetical protein